MDPLYDLGPLKVALAHDRPERLLRDHVRKNDVVVRLPKPQAQRVELGKVAGENRAARILVVLDRLACGRGRDLLQGQMIGREEVGEISYGCRPALNADPRAIELERRSDLERAWSHESLPVVVGHPDE